MKKPTRPVDWAEIEKDYRAGSMSNVALGDWYSVSEAAIRKRAKAHGWVRAGSTSNHAPAPQEPGRTVATLETTSPAAIIDRGRNLTLRLLDELDATTSRVGELREIIDFAVDGSDDKAKAAIEKALSLKERADVLKALALTAKTFAEAGAPAGKKAERQERANAAATNGGRFATRQGPKLAVSND